jgi:Uncharacterized protein conserved in bacteria
MLTIRYSTKFKKDYKLAKKRGYNIKLLEEVLDILCAEQPHPSPTYEPTSPPASNLFV